MPLVLSCLTVYVPAGTIVPCARKPKGISAFNCCAEATPVAAARAIAASIKFVVRFFIFLPSLRVSCCIFHSAEESVLFAICCLHPIKRQPERKTTTATKFFLGSCVGEMSQVSELGSCKEV